jgi:hypothetical protein
MTSSIESFKPGWTEEPHADLYHRVVRLLIDAPDAQRWTGKHGPDGPIMEPRPYHKGQLVKVVMISTWGDVGLTDDLYAENGYDIRTEPENLEVVEKHKRACFPRRCKTCRQYGIRQTT